MLYKSSDKVPSFSLRPFAIKWLSEDGVKLRSFFDNFKLRIKKDLLIFTA